MVMVSALPPKLVEDMKEKIKTDPSNYHFIRNKTIVSVIRTLFVGHGPYLVRNQKSTCICQGGTMVTATDSVHAVAVVMLALART